jgi:hypothetical protein
MLSNGACRSWYQWFEVPYLRQRIGVGMANHIVQLHRFVCTIQHLLLLLKSGSMATM